MMKLMISAALLCAASGAACAATIDPQGNGTIAGAAEIPLAGEVGAAAWPVTLDNTGRDVDFFKIQLAEDQVVVVSTGTNFGPFVPSPDTALALFDASGEILVAFNDNSGDNNAASPTGSLVQATIDQAGTYYIGVTGSGDANFDGLDDIAQLTNADENALHDERGLYLLSVSYFTIPTPGSGVLTSIAGGILLARRRR